MNCRDSDASEKINVDLNRKRLRGREKEREREIEREGGGARRRGKEEPDRQQEGCTRETLNSTPLLRNVSITQKSRLEKE